MKRERRKLQLDLPFPSFYPPGLQESQGHAAIYARRRLCVQLEPLKVEVGIRERRRVRVDKVCGAVSRRQRVVVRFYIPVQLPEQPSLLKTAPAQSPPVDPHQHSPLTRSAHHYSQSVKLITMFCGPKCELRLQSVFGNSAYGVPYNNQTGPKFGEPAHDKNNRMERHAPSCRYSHSSPHSSHHSAHSPRSSSRTRP